MTEKKDEINNDINVLTGIINNNRPISNKDLEEEKVNM